MFFERKAETNLIRNSLNKLVKENKGDVIVVEGFAGMGKSKLATQMMDIARKMNCLYVIGTADAIEISTPFFVWKNVVRQLLILLNPENTRNKERLEKSVKEFVGKKWTSYIPLMNDLIPSLGFKEKEENISSKLTTKQRRNHLSNLIGAIILQKASSPLFLILENLQWMDDYSVSLLQLMLTFVSQKPILILLTTRSDSKSTKKYLDILNNINQITSRSNHLFLPPLSNKSIVAIAYSHMFPFLFILF